MAKGLGLIGNFKGKVGNVVGYNLKDSNNNQTQGVRIYQPVVRNPKTYAQAEQRARMAVINATYRALKSIIDRGQEGKPYGNKSRLAWLSDAMKNFNGAWIEKGKAIAHPAVVPLTKGSLPSVALNTIGEADIHFDFVVAEGTTIPTFGALSTEFLKGYPALKEGDQITIVSITSEGSALLPHEYSFVIDTENTTPQSAFTLAENRVEFSFENYYGKSVEVLAVILSREGADGSHLRSTTSLALVSEVQGAPPYDDASKEAAIRSYMASGSTSDWPQVPDENA